MSRSKTTRILKTSGIILCAVTFITLSIIIYFFRVEPLAIDEAVRDFAYSIRGQKYGFMYWFFRLITEFGNYLMIIVILFVAAFYTKVDYRFILLAFGIMLSTIINVGLKDLYSRERPILEMRWMSEDTTSFPSGHSTAAGFMYSFIIYLIYHEDYNKKVKVTVYSICGALIPLVMFSRIILGVHYFTDVIAGAATGIMVSCLCMLLYRYCVNNNILSQGLLKWNRKSKKEKTEDEE
ncbi:MAG: phosphatase PAP2 family protein [Erysipelotrichaceae bacterium]|nr:phosphatase PAP2 family protein [Erysipelotrichaceae bacterium]